MRIDDDEYVNNSHTPTRIDLAKVLDKLRPGRDRDVVLLLALTGARIGEVAALHVRDYDPESRTLMLSGRDEQRDRRGKVKARRWPVAGELRALVERLAGDRDGTERLIGGLPKDCAWAVQEALRLACDLGEVPRFTAHGLRRMVAMELLEHADPRRVSELTGHSVATLLRYYVRPRAEDLRDLVVRSGVTAVEQRGTVRRLRALKSGTRRQDED